MDFQAENKKGYTVIKTSVEKLNATNAPDLKAVLVRINNDSVNNVILDLSGVKYCDSSGLSAILTGNRLCKNSNGKFTICNLSPTVLKMIEIAQLHRVLNIVKDLEAAKKEF